MVSAIVISIAVQGQEETNENKKQNESDQIQTLFSQTGRVGWWVGPEFSYCMIDEKSAFLGGISGGIIVNSNFSIGLTGSGIITTSDLRFSGINDTADVYLYGGFGGLRLEYRIKPDKVINLAFPVTIGGGGAAYSTWGPNDWNNSQNGDINNDSYIWDSYFLIEPGVAVGINILKFMRLDVGISYKFTSGLSLPETDKNMLDGFNANLGLRFGRF